MYDHLYARDEAIRLKQVIFRRFWNELWRTREDSEPLTSAFRRAIQVVPSSFIGKLRLLMSDSSITHDRDEAYCHIFWDVLEQFWLVAVNQSKLQLAWACSHCRDYAFVDNLTRQPEHCIQPEV